MLPIHVSCMMHFDATHPCVMHNASWYDHPCVMHDASWCDPSMRHAWCIVIRPIHVSCMMHRDATHPCSHAWCIVMRPIHVSCMNRGVRPIHVIHAWCIVMLPTHASCMMYREAFPHQHVSCMLRRDATYVCVRMCSNDVENHCILEGVDSNDVGGQPSHGVVCILKE